MKTIDDKEMQVGHTRRAQCKYGPTNLACDSSANGTSSLLRHIKQFCKGYPDRIDLENDQDVFTSDGTNKPSVMMRSWTQEACVEASDVMIVFDELHFSAIERPGFRHAFL
ncbi:hypothetical protein M0R45_001037 [Rubus argutus]|uniref:Uncharacterized protein n=1 Tax=Rubus argutus TaxID=59490 RepID=A0AAW1VJV8_RUBAR